MKSTPACQLHSRDVEPYLAGHNVIRYTDPNGGIPDIFVGEILRITDDHQSDIVTAIYIETKWLIRVRRALDVGTNGESMEWRPIDGSLQHNYKLRFDHPVVIKRRGPLTFSSNDGIKVEITHVTELAETAMKIRGEIQTH